MMRIEEAIGREAGKRSVMRCGGYRIIMCIKVKFNNCGGVCYCQGLQWNKKNGINV
jgi:hypothetical protein